MADEQQLAVLRQGSEAWNAWREQNADVRPELSDADLSRADLARANLAGADLREASLAGAHLSGADLKQAELWKASLANANLSHATLTSADLRHVNFHGANLTHADLHGAFLGYAYLDSAQLSGANLSNAHLDGAELDDANLYIADLRDADFSCAVLYGTNFTGANVSGADFAHANLRETVFADVDLGQAKSLDTCEHEGPSIIDYRTLQRSGQLPLSFLRGCGLPDNLIEYLPALLDQPIQFYSCFISYSSQDNEFAQRLYADLQNNGVRCWFAPHDLPIGARTRDTIDIAIRVRDKLLIVLSENSINSDWVEEEVETALEEERDSENRRTVLFPIRIDDAVFQTQRAWARKLRRERNIGDFTGWKDHDAYSGAFERLLRDLKVKLTT